MTKEEKQLLLKDLCARLPYGVKVSLENYHIEEFPYNGTYCESIIILGISDSSSNLLKNVEKYGVKPYLRPMSSMTEEEKELMKGSVICFNEFEGNSTLFDEIGLDWLNAHHFDYRGLISMGLALEAPEGIYE